MITKKAPLIITLFLTLQVAFAEEWRFQGFGGVVYNLPTPLIIRQSGEEDIRLTARYETRPFEKAPAPYYVVRLGRWKEGSSYELELIHSKIYLKNKPPEVQEFKITYGYNYLLLNRAWEVKKFILRVGGGLVITHPSNVVRGRENRYVTYDLSGVGAQLGIERILISFKRFFLSGEIKITGAYAEVPVADGYAIVPNLAVHAVLGAGFSF